MAISALMDRHNQTGVSKSQVEANFALLAVGPGLYDMFRPWHGWASYHLIVSSIQGQFPVVEQLFYLRFGWLPEMGTNLVQYRLQHAWKVGVVFCS